MHHPTDRIPHTTAFVKPVVEHWLERGIAQWVHPMKDRSDDPSHHARTLLLVSIHVSLFSAVRAVMNKASSVQCSTTGVTKVMVCAILCGMVHIKEPLLLISKSSPCGSIGFTLSLSEWSFPICPTLNNRKLNVLSVSLSNTDTYRDILS